MNVTTPIAGMWITIHVRKELWLNDLLGWQKIQKNSTIHLQGDVIIQGSKPPIPLHIIKKGLTKKRYNMFVLAAHIENAVAQKQIVFLHASSFVYKNRAYLYLGKSGAGKSTLIAKHTIQDRLSNDTAIVQIERGKPYVYKSIFDRNEIQFDPAKKAPLAHIFILKQAHENSIKNISLEKKLRFLMRNDYFLMNEDQIRLNNNQTTNKNIILKTILSLIKIPISELLFTPSLQIKTLLP